MKETFYETYQPNIDFGNFDHIIIGSGIGGLTVGTWLAKAGKKVIILEQHYKPGGFTHSFERKGFKWDTGVHYVGNVGKNDALRPFFDLLTEHKTEWASLGETYDIIKIAGKSYEFKAGKENFKKQIKSYFPDESKAIDKYISLVEKVNQLAAAFFFEKSLKAILSKTIGFFIRRRFNKFSNKTTEEVLKTLTNNKLLIAVLTGQFGNYGLTANLSSFAAHALIVGHFLEGAYYPKGGVDSISKDILENFYKHGGRLFVKANVSKIVTQKNKLKGIQIGERFISCSSVISDAGVNNTFNHLLSEEARTICKFDLKGVKPSIGHMCLYVGLDKSSEELKLPKSNLWLYENKDFNSLFEEQELSNLAKKTAYISFPSAKDPKWNENYPNKATIQIITMGRYNWFKPFEKLPLMKRGEEYMKIKKEYEEIMLDKLIKLYPQVEQHIVKTEVSSPLSTKHFSNYKHGEIYGLEHSPERFNLPFLRSETKIKGLRLVGQDIMVVGLAGSMLSGMFAATTILKFRVWKLFREMAQNKGN